MKILISGGTKTDNIVTGISKRFTSGGVDFIIVPFIQDIDSIYQRGEYFDKAIILEQSWTQDFTDSDEVSIRNKINNFANSSAARRLENAGFVFLTQDEETANSVYEEILAIQNSSVVLIKQPRYSVTFFASLVTTEIDKFPTDIVYVPKVEAEVSVEPTLPKEEEPQSIDYEPDYERDIEQELFGESGYNGNKLELESGIQIKKEDEDIPEMTDELPPLEEVDYEEPPIQPIFDEPYIEEPYIPEPENVGISGEIPEFEGDLNLGGYEPGEPYADIPPMDEPEFISEGGFEDITDVASGDFPAPGFEDVEVEVEGGPQYQSGEIPDYSGDDLATPPLDTEPSGINFMKQEPEMEIEPEVVEEPPMYMEEPYIEEEPVVYPSGEIPDYSGEDEQAQMLGGINFAKEDEEQYIEEPPVDENFQYVDEPPIYTPSDSEGYNPAFDEYSAGHPGFSDEDYEGERELVAPTQSRQTQPRVDMTNDQIKVTLDAFANRGNSILVTGCGGCGTSTIALNLAEIINNLGYTVLLVDLDTENKTQSYISKENYDSVDHESSGLMAAINSTSGINAHISIVREGFHLLTMGMASDSVKIDKVVQKEKISRFINLAKTSHNFVIYDAPFATAVGFGKDFTFMADNIVLTVDCSNWGITKAMLTMGNIDDDDMRETMYNRGQLLFNRYRVLNKVMGRKVKTALDITKVMDFKTRDLIGEDPSYYFQSMHVCGLINEDSKFEAGWFENIQYADTDVGSKIFLEILKNIVLKR